MTLDEGWQAIQSVAPKSLETFGRAFAGLERANIYRTLLESPENHLQ